MVDQAGKQSKSMQHWAGLPFSLDDLADGDSIRTSSVPLIDDSFQERKPYYVHLSVTGRCNARCAGCVNSDVTFRNSDRSWLSPAYDTDPGRDAKAIIHLLENLGEREIIVSFYGGEPLLLSESINTVVSILSANQQKYSIRYMIYTNGQLLGKFTQQYPGLASDIWLWAVSIDGTREQHNSIRLGTDIDVIHRNLADLQNLRTGPVIMWSTLREEQSLMDCFEEFLFLRSQNYADHFFWHWIETDKPFNSVERYAARYARELTAIMDAYMKELSEGKVLSLVHINELILYLLTGKERGSSACAVEQARNFDIMGGKVHPCADLPPEYAIGTIDEYGKPHISPRNLNTLVDYKYALGCYECGIHSYCGGRCPVQALTGTEIRLKQYCRLMRLHVGIVIEYVPNIVKYLSEHRIKLQQIYDQSAFYAQFTDVTP